VLHKYFVATWQDLVQAGNSCREQQISRTTENFLYKPVTMQRTILGAQPFTSRPSVAPGAGRCSRSIAAKAQGGPSNPIGIHAQVWVGDWSKEEAVTAISGTKKAGYDLIERKSIPGMHHLRFSLLGKARNCLCNKSNKSYKNEMYLHFATVHPYPTLVTVGKSWQVLPFLCKRSLVQSDPSSPSSPPPPPTPTPNQLPCPALPHLPRPAPPHIDGGKLNHRILPAVNVSVPESIDAQMTKGVLKDHDLGASASLVCSHPHLSSSTTLVSCHPELPALRS